MPDKRPSELLLDEKTSIDEVFSLVGIRSVKKGMNESVQRAQRELSRLPRGTLPDLGVPSSFGEARSHVVRASKVVTDLLDELEEVLDVEEQDPEGKSELVSSVISAVTEFENALEDIEEEMSKVSRFR